MTRKILSLALVAAAGAAGILLESDARASNAIAEQEGMVCTACHDKPGSKLLTDRGKYYEVMGSLDGFEDVNEVFGSCTACHVRKPGSKKLTADGRAFARLAGDMQGLRALLESEHPQPADEAELEEPEEEAETPGEADPEKGDS